jgi:replicative DNA helicase
MPERDLTNKLLAHKGIPLRITEEPWQISKDAELLRNYNEATDEIEHWQSDIIFESNLGAKRIAEITEQREYDVIFVDHVHKFAWGGDRRVLEEQIQALNSIALEMNVMVVLLCQLRKFDQRPGAAAYPKPTLQSFRETSVIAEEASLALAIWRHTNEDGTKFDGQTMAFVLKNRHVTGRHDAAGVGIYLNFDPERELFVPAATGHEQGGTFEVDANGVQLSHE